MWFRPPGTILTAGKVTRRRGKGGLLLAGTCVLTRPWRAAFARTADRSRPLGFRSLRARIVGVAVLLLTVCGTGSTLLADRLLGMRMWERVAGSLAEELDDFDRYTAAAGARSGRLPADTDARSHLRSFLDYNTPAREQALVAVAGGAVEGIVSERFLLPQLPAPLLQRWAQDTARAAPPPASGGRFDTELGAAAYEIRRVRDATGTHGALILVTLPAGELREVDELRSVALTVTLATILLGSLAAFLLVGRLLGPMRQLGDTARAISRSDLGPRLEVRGDAEVDEMARSFNAMVDRLEETVTDMRDLAQDTAHELRAPLTVCRCELMAIRDGLAAPDGPARVAIGEIDRMSRLVADLQTLGELRHAGLQACDFELAQWTRGVFERTRALGPRAWQLEALGQGHVRADPDLLSQAVLNLARNAVQHTAPEAPVAIGSVVEAGEAHIWVRDWGPGVAEAERAHIFERFARGRDAAERYPGAGLGLAIVRGVARAHAGRVELESRPGAGATFTLSLPIEVGDPEHVPDTGR